MNVAAIDTATPSTVAAVLRADGRVFEARDDPGPGERPGHATRVLALLERALADAGLSWPEVPRIGVGVGPGGFTGLRIGIATARGLAQSHGLELVGVSSLEALAAGRDVVAAIDARRREVFALGAGVPAAAYDPAALARRVSGREVAGGGALVYREVFEDAGCRVAPDDDPGHRIGGEALCRLAAAGTPAGPEGVLPDYRRDPDAVPLSGQ